MDHHVLSTGQRIGTIRHACPECPIAHPRSLCAICGGLGTVSEEELDAYEARWNDNHRKR